MDNRKSLDYDNEIVLTFNYSDYMMYYYKMINNYLMKKKIKSIMILKYNEKGEYYNLVIKCHSKNTEDIKNIIKAIDKELADKGW